MTKRDFTTLLAIPTLAILLTQTAAAQFSAKITGPAVWQKGQPLSLTWTYTGTPPASLQAGVQVRAVTMAGTSTNYIFTQSVPFAAKATQVPAMNFTYTQNTAVVIVLTDMSGAQVTHPFSVVITIPPPYNFQLQITSVPAFAANQAAAPVQWTYAGTPPASLAQCGVDVLYTVAGRAYQLSRANPVAGHSGATGSIGFPAGTSGVITLADSCSGQNLTPQGATDVVSAASSTPVAPPAAPPATISGDPTLARAACNYILGRDCNSSENSALIQPGKQGPLYTTRAAMQVYLINYLGVNPNVKSAVVQLAATAVYGNRAICTESINALNSSFTPDPNSTATTSWNSYAQLVTATAAGPALVSATVTKLCGANAPTAPGQTGSPADISAACQWAFGRGGCTTDYALANDPNLTGMEQALASAIKSSASLMTTIATNAYTAVNGKAPCTAALTDLVSRFNSNSVSTPQPLVSWAGYAQLTTLSNGQTLAGNEAAKCVAAPPTQISSTTMSMIANSYHSDFGRAATTQETAYWASVSPTDPRIQSPAAFLANDIAYLKTTPSEREATIQRAYADTWNVTIAVTSPEMKFWEPKVVAGQVVYSGIKNANGAFQATNPKYIPGTALTTPVKSPASYSLKSADGTDGSGNVWDTFVAGLNAAIWVVIPGVPPSPALASVPPTPLPPPLGWRQSLHSTNQSLFSSPRVIAATYSSEPFQSFCLDTQSWNPGSKVVAVPCTGGDSQLFNVDEQDRIVAQANPHGKLCIDGGALPSGGQNFNALLLNPCTDSPSQKWFWNTISGLREGSPSVNNYWGSGPNNASNGEIQNKGNNLCINLSGGNPNPVNSVIAFPCQPVVLNQSIRPWNEVWGAGDITSTGGAYIFLRFTPPLVGLGLGHVGWGIQLADGSWEGGGWDGPELSNGVAIAVVEMGYNNNAWRHHFATEADLRRFFLLGECNDNMTNGNPYDQYIRVQLTSLPGTSIINSAAVFSLESQSWDWGYGVAGNNCMNTVYKILRAYGWSLPAPSALVLYPKDWFANVVASLNVQPLWLHGSPWDRSTANGPLNSAKSWLTMTNTPLKVCWSTDPNRVL